MNKQSLEALISACESEPIHIPGGIQAFGAMLVFTPHFAALQQASANSAEFFGQDSIWSTSVHSLLGGEVVQQLHEALQFGEYAAVEANGFAYHAYISEPYWVIEVENLAPHATHFSVPKVLHSALNALKAQHDPQELLQTLTEQIRMVSGFERVMVYQFDHEWHGQVAAEATGQYLQSMRDHHFPASDIPPQARAMYSKNPFRIIGSASASPISMQGNPQAEASTAVDMSQGALRAVSPVHMQYLQNLGVAASCSIGIFNDDTLWGIIACHHTQELWLHFKVRAALTLIVQFASQRFFHLQHQAVHRFQRQVYQLRDELAQHQTSSSSFEQIFQHHIPAWLELIQADGCCYVEDTQVLHATGGTPKDHFIRDITALLAQQAMPQSYWSTRSVTEYLNDATDANYAGLLAIPMRLSAQRRGWLLFFRPELIERRNWAGKPEKAIYKGLTGDMLGPRKSFSMWQQIVEGQSAAWTQEQLFAARDLARDLLIFTHRETV